MTPLTNENSTLSDTTAINSTGMDIADLVCTLLSLESPDREVDILIEVLLCRKDYQAEIKVSDVRGRLWLRSQVPHYTEGTVAIAGLAHKRGYLLEYLQNGNEWIVETRDLVSEDKICIRHKLKGVAAVVGIASLISRKSK